MDETIDGFGPQEAEEATRALQRLEQESLPSLPDASDDFIEFDELRSHPDRPALGPDKYARAYELGLDHGFTWWRELPTSHDLLQPTVRWAIAEGILGETEGERFIRDWRDRDHRAHALLYELELLAAHRGRKDVAHAAPRDILMWAIESNMVPKDVVQHVQRVLGSDRMMWRGD